MSEDGQDPMKHDGNISMPPPTTPPVASRASLALGCWLDEPWVKRQLDFDLMETFRQLALAAAKDFESLPQPARARSKSSAQELVWCCALFITHQIFRKERGYKNLEMDKLVHNCGFPLVEFFKMLRLVSPKFLPHISPVCGRGEAELEKALQLRETQMTYVFTSTVMKRFTDMYAGKFELHNPANPSSDCNYRLGWTAFVLAKARLMPALPDLVSCFHLLVAVFNVLLVHMPERLLRGKLTDPMFLPEKTPDGRVDTVASLASSSKGIASEVLPLSKRLDDLLVQLLKDSGLEVQETHPDSGLVTGCSYFPGLLSDGATAPPALGHLEAAYAAALEDQGAFFSELVFLEAETSGVLTSPLRMTPRVSQWNPPQGGVFRSGSSYTLPSPLRQPLQGGGSVPMSPMLGTPSQTGQLESSSMADALSATAWLRELSSSHRARPSEEILRFARNCDVDKTSDIEARAKDLAHAVLPDNRHAEHSMDEGTFVQRREEAIKVYYRVLEQVLVGEERRSGSSNLTNLLGSNSFHRCLMACSFEVVVSSYRMIIMPFTEVLERLGLKAFDIFKIIQCFVRHEPTLPREIKRHLVSIEEQVVECLAWGRGSSLYPTLIGAKAQLDAVANNPLASLRKSRKRTLFTEGTDSPPTGSSSPVPGSKLMPVKTQLSSFAQSAGLGSSGKPPMSPTALRLRGSGGSVSSSESTPTKMSSPSTPMEGSPTPSTGAPAFHLTTPKKQRLAGGGALATPGTPTSGGVTKLPQCIGKSIEESRRADTPMVMLMRDFFKKTTILSAIRLAQLCERLDVTPYDHTEFLGRVYNVARDLIFDHTSLLYGRHLDQMLMCCLYGVAKVMHMEKITFKEVTSHYRKLSGADAGSSSLARQEIFRNVVIRFAENSLQPAETGDIITFYNKVFIPRMKDVLMATASEPLSTVRASPDPHRQSAGSQHYTTERTVPASPNRRASTGGTNFPSSPLQGRAQSPGGLLMPFSPQKRQVEGGHKIVVSPMRDLTMTPRTKSLYCAGNVGDHSSPAMRKLQPFGQGTGLDSVGSLQGWLPDAEGARDSMEWQPWRRASEPGNGALQRDDSEEPIPPFPSFGP